MLTVSKGTEALKWSWSVLFDAPLNVGKDLFATPPIKTENIES